MSLTSPKLMISKLLLLLVALVAVVLGLSEAGLFASVILELVKDHL